ncbi:hypothetical protein DNTS_023452 [Danionella cerebrum]|uniref:Ig-like domain-containing protein n=1 Tax=Danionella cerebrum TaxID=2873325 RepID=A0A553QUZ6_9TELE|nr:hypothetical protein DNTS_023452 [Danionella translucida]
MASIGQIIFGSMICLIVVISGILIFILAVAFSASKGNVESTTPSLLGDLEDDVVLDCRFIASSSSGQMSDVSVTWLKDALSGVVYEYKNKAPQLQQQNPQFKNRAQLFPEVLSTGNVSLLLRNVKLEDDGVYHCAVDAAQVKGTASIDFRVAAYSAPTFTAANGSLCAKAKRWFPQPEVLWFNENGQILNSSTSFINKNAGIVQVTSVLQEQLQQNFSYTCKIQNALVTGISEATVTANNVTQKTYFEFSDASANMPSPGLVLTFLFSLSALQ